MGRGEAFGAVRPRPPATVPPECFAPAAEKPLFNRNPYETLVAPEIETSVISQSEQFYLGFGASIRSGVVSVSDVQVHVSTIPLEHVSRQALLRVILFAFCAREFCSEDTDGPEVAVIAVALQQTCLLVPRHLLAPRWERIAVQRARKCLAVQVVADDRGGEQEAARQKRCEGHWHE
jgi:hypothetical protein